MMHGCGVLLLVLVALLTTLSDGYGYAPAYKAYECPGLQKQVYAVRDEVEAVMALLHNMTAGSTTVLHNQETLINISDTLIDRRDEVRFVVQDIRRGQADNLDTSLGAFSDVEETWLQKLGDLAGDVTQLHANQKVLQTTLEQTAADLTAGHEDLSQELRDAKRQLQDVRERLLQDNTDTKSLRADVRVLVDLLEGL